MKVPQGLKSVRENRLSPRLGLVFFFQPFPRLAPWAEFLRRFATNGVRRSTTADIPALTQTLKRILMDW